jgi:hypothetical protein
LNGLCAVAFAADNGVATQPVAVALRMVVTAVDGQAQIKVGSDAAWERATVGMTFPVGSQIRTGVPGVLQFTVGDDHVYRVDRLSLVQVVEADEADSRIKTVVGMTFGRVSKEVDAPVLPHDDTIIAPGGSLATRGTRVSLYDQPPYEPEAVSLTGMGVSTFPGVMRAVAFGAEGEGLAVVTPSHPDAAQQRLVSYIIDPSIANARTPAEQQLLPDVIGNGAVINISNPDTLPTVSNTGFPATSQLKSLYSGDLIFYVRWDTDTHVQIELVAQGNSVQPGEYIQPSRGLDTSPSGGHVLFDNLGGPAGGFEVIVYPNDDFPNNSAYAVGATNLGPIATTVTFDAFITGADLTPKPINGLIRQKFLNPNNLVASPTNEVVQGVVPGQTGGALTLVHKTSRDIPGLFP